MSNNSNAGRGPKSPPTPPAKDRPAPPAKGRPAPPAKGRPAPPAKDRPAPPAKGRPAPPNNSPPKPPNKKVNHSEEIDRTQKMFQRAMKLEDEENYAEAAVLYRELEMQDNENRCLNLALAKAKAVGTTNIHYGDKIVNDSVIMKDD